MSSRDRPSPGTDPSNPPAGAGPATAATVVSAALCVVAAGAIGFALGGVFDQLRATVLNSVFGNDDSTIPPAVRGWMLPLGILAVIIAAMQYETWRIRRADAVQARDAGADGAGPSLARTLIILGVTLGFCVSALLWTSPDAIGVAVDPSFGDDESWGAGAWVLVTGQWWAPALLIALSAWSIREDLRARRSRRAARRRAAAAMLSAEEHPPA